MAAKTEKIIRSLQTSLADAQFHKKVFDAAAVHSDREEYLELSDRLDETGIQDSSAVRNVLFTRRVAKALLDEKGALLHGELKKQIEQLKKGLYSLGPRRGHDGKRNTHLLEALELLAKDKQIQILLKQIGRPYSNPRADQLIRDTLDLPKNERLTDFHARWAALSAWFCFLRQSVGSCFATAPAILIQREQPKQFLTDLRELLNTGQLKRTFEGVEYVFPLSASWGGGDLRRQYLMHRASDKNRFRPWRAPGILRALNAAGVIEGEDEAAAEKIFQELLSNFPGDLQRFLVSPEPLLEGALLRHFGLTEKEVIDFRNRPVGLIQSGILLEAGRMGRKDHPVEKYLKALDEAKKAFLMLADNALLKAWEFTVASFSESKASFTRWNLYSSLGFQQEDHGGIGPVIYQAIKQKVDYHNERLRDLQGEYEQVYTQVKFLESRMRRAETEQDLKWIRIEYQSKISEFRSLEEMRDTHHHKANRLANLYNDLLELYYEFFPKYFQEVYDADMHEVTVGPYDDSPAGFHLLCKHGRAAASAWTAVENANDFVRGLSAFFASAEHEMMQDARLQGLEEDLSEITTNVVTHVKSRQFLESAFHRMARAHNVPAIKDPLENLDRVEKKPWAYTSGGTMDNLISTYYKREAKPSEVSRFLESPVELLQFLVDTVKKIPSDETYLYENQPDKSLLMHSPTHAFLLKPGYSKFKEGWENDEYTYTFIRDRWIRPMKEFTSHLMLDKGMAMQLNEQLAERIPEHFRKTFHKQLFSLPNLLSPSDYRDLVIEMMSLQKGIQLIPHGWLSPDDIDSVLFESLPFFPVYKLKERVADILTKVDPDRKDEAMSHFETFQPRVMSREFLPSCALVEICLGLLILTYGEPSLPYDARMRIIEESRNAGYAQPEPVLFADTNWVKDYFGVVVNPGTGEPELWRLDYTGSTGAPMSSWRHWLDGSRKKPDWGIYTRFYEYSAERNLQ